MSFKKTKEIMAVRRKAAEERQAAYDKLTLEQKLAKLPPEPQAARQRAKLLKQLEAGKQKSAVKEEVQAETNTEVKPEVKKSKKTKKEGK